MFKKGGRAADSSEQEGLALRTLMLVALLACAGTLASQAQEKSESDAAAKILALEHMWGQSYVSKDPKALERILDDAFVNVDSDGNLQNKAEVLAEVRESTMIQFFTESMVVRLHGNTAIVTGVFVMRGLDHGKAYAQRDRFEDTWFYKSGQWVSIAGMVTRIEQ